MGVVSDHFVSTFTTFSGVDITAMFDDMTVMTLQGVAVSVTREKVPVYIFGKSRPVSISRGKRGIAGTLQFVLFDHEPLYDIYENHKYYAHQDEVRWLFDPQSVGVHGGPAVSVKSLPDYMDQVWPFDITLIAQNEYGQAAWSAIIGVEIINEGGGISMDDLTNERQATFIALHRTPWTPLNEYDRSTVDFEQNSFSNINFNASHTGYTVNPQVVPSRSQQP